MALGHVTTGVLWEGPPTLASPAFEAPTPMSFLKQVKYSISVA